MLEHADILHQLFVKVFFQMIPVYACLHAVDDFDCHAGY